MKKYMIKRDNAVTKYLNANGNSVQWSADLFDGRFYNSPVDAHQEMEKHNTDTGSSCYVVELNISESKIKLKVDYVPTPRTEVRS